MSKEELFNKIATFTGGRVAEELKFGSVTTGASNDIEQATRLARRDVTRYGMSEEFGMVALETSITSISAATPLWPAPMKPQRRLTRLWLLW